MVIHDGNLIAINRLRGLTCGHIVNFISHIECPHQFLTSGSQSLDGKSLQLGHDEFRRAGGWSKLHVYWLANSCSLFQFMGLCGLSIGLIDRLLPRVELPGQFDTLLREAAITYKGIDKTSTPKNSIHMFV